MSFRRCELWRSVTSSIIQTILSVSELHRFNLARLADYHRRSGITPCPEDISIQLFYCLHYSTVFPECKHFFQERFDSCAPGAYNGGHTRKEAAAMPERENTCCFTGHREYKLPWGSDENDPRCRKLQQQLFDAVDAVYAAGIRHFICGMANGCDLYFSMPHAICACSTRRSQSRRPSPTPARPTAGGRSCASATPTTCASATIRRSYRRPTPPGA